MARLHPVAVGRNAGGTRCTFEEVEELASLLYQYPFGKLPQLASIFLRLQAMLRILRRTRPVRHRCCDGPKMRKSRAGCLKRSEYRRAIVSDIVDHSCTVWTGGKSLLRVRGGEVIVMQELLGQKDTRQASTERSGHRYPEDHRIH